MRGLPAGDQTGPTCRKWSSRVGTSHRGIVITVADKRSDVVVQNTSDYKTEIYRQLNFSQHYERLTEPLYPTTAIKLTKILARLKRLQFITPKQFAYLAPPPNPWPRRIYTIPKIHKAPSDWYFPFKIPRPSYCQ